jgi:hypothetical protein
MKNTIGLLMLIFIFSACKNTKIAQSANASLYSLADSNATAKALLQEDGEGFFSKIQAIDVAIQLKDNALLKDADYLNKYKTSLKTQASSFSKSESETISMVADEAIALFKSINLELPTKFQLCKIKTEHYGKDVYYTRGNAIFIPDNIFVNFKKDEQLPIMLHEIWHVISEANPAVRDKMYGLIGFNKHHMQIKYPESLKKLLLTNPDGAHDDYAITLQGGKKALPIILSGKEKFDAANPSLFNHLKFELYGIDDKGSIEMNVDLSSKLTNEQQASFFSKIKDNTQYIIHPDEIIADNVMLAILANKSGDYTKFNVQGKVLIEQVLNVLKHN